jgi:hypothetical protein
MSTLAELQHDFQHFLLEGDASVRGEIESAVDISADTRLEVYAQAYRLRLLEALGKDYPGLKGLIGDAAFEAAGRAYIDQYPSQHPSLRWFGRYFPEFLLARDEAAPKAANSLSPETQAEIAAFEWSSGECFDAADTAIVGIDAMSEVPADQWANLRLRFQPGLRRLNLHCNAPAIWKAANDGEALPGVERNATPIAWVLWRREMKIFWRSLTTDEAEALDAAIAGGSFGEICELLCAHVGDDAAPMRAATLLRQWLHDGMVIATAHD